jgi:hypothetical protein
MAESGYEYLLSLAYLISAADIDPTGTGSKVLVAGPEEH